MTVLDSSAMQSPDEFLAQLATAKHEAQIVIAINVDIRGFSIFSLDVESVEASIFVKKFYDRLLRDYFIDPAFFKPTGDGMLMIFPADEDAEQLTARTNGLVTQCLRLVDDFPTLVAEEPIINFRVPDHVGVGMARGAASRLVAGDTVLDYSGKVLNLASRLMDRAKPEGLILDESVGVDLLAEELRRSFARDEIYVPSVAEQRAITVFYTSALTRIPESAHHPIGVPRWHTQSQEWTCGQVVGINTTRYWIDLERQILDPEQVFVKALYPDVGADGQKKPRVRAWEDMTCTFRERAGVQSIAIDTNALGAKLVAKGVPADWPLTLEIAYPLADE